MMPDTIHWVLFWFIWLVCGACTGACLYYLFDSRWTDSWTRDTISFFGSIFWPLVIPVACIVLVYRYIFRATMRILYRYFAKNDY